MAKIIVSETAMKRIINEEMSQKDIAKAVSQDKEFEKHIRDIVKDVLKNDNEANKISKEKFADAAKTDKELEKRIKNVSADIVSKFLKTLWQRSNFFDAELRN